MLRVLHVTPYYEPAYVYGGPVRSVPLLCQALVRAGAEVTVLTTDANGRERLDLPLGQPLSRAGVTVYYFARRSPGSIFYSPGLASACRALIPQTDLVHVTGLWTHPSSSAASVSRGRGKPYVISPRGMLMPWEFRHRAWKKLPWFYLFEATKLRCSSAIHCTTEDEKAALSRFGLDSCAFVLPNGIDLAEFAGLPPRRALRARLGIALQAQIMLFLGRLHAKKGIELVLSLFAVLASDYPDLHLVLAGPDEGGYAMTTPRWAVEHGLASRVHVTGELHGASRLEAFAAADLFILLSHSENFGMSAAEAMACGLPVVVSKNVGISPHVAAAGAGFAVSRSLDDAVLAVRAILDGPERAQGMGLAGRQLVEAEFSIDATGERMLAVYRDLLAHGTAAPRPVIA